MCFKPGSCLPSPRSPGLHQGASWSGKIDQAQRLPLFLGSKSWFQVRVGEQRASLRSRSSHRRSRLSARHRLMLDTSSHFNHAKCICNMSRVTVGDCHCAKLFTQTASASTIGLRRRRSSPESGRFAFLFHEAVVARRAPAVQHRGWRYQYCRRLGASIVKRGRRSGNDTSRAWLSEAVNHRRVVLVAWRGRAPWCSSSSKKPWSGPAPRQTRLRGTGSHCYDCCSMHCTLCLPKFL